VVINTVVRSSNYGYTCTTRLNVQDVRKRYQVSRNFITVLIKSPQLDSIRSYKIPVHTEEQEVGPTYRSWFNTQIYLRLVLCPMQSNRIVVITLMETRSWTSYSGTKKVTNTFSIQADSPRTLPLI
jgi:hypothetical protein